MSASRSERGTSLIAYLIMRALIESNDANRNCYYTVEQPELATHAISICNIVADDLRSRLGG